MDFLLRDADLLPKDPTFLKLVSRKAYLKKYSLEVTPHNRSKVYCGTTVTHRKPGHLNSIHLGYQCTRVCIYVFSSCMAVGTA